MDNCFLMESERHPDGYLSRQDNILDPVSLDELITTLHCNCKVIDGKAVKNTLHEILDSRLEDMWAIVYANMDEIIAEAYQGRDENPLTRADSE